MASYEDNPAIQRFVKYLQIPSVHPNVDYEPCLAFLKSQAEDIRLPYTVYQMFPGKPFFIMTWEGQEPEIESCMLVSHMDVVPVFAENWTYPPFSGHIDEDGKIFARGSQDMKCVGMQYLEAIRRLKNSHIRFRRTIHVCFSPDEEIGGSDGMKKFVHSNEFKKLNVGISLDEGMASPTEEYGLYYGERTIWHLIIKCPGTPGHGSLLLKNTAGEKIRKVINKFMDFRDKELRKMENDPSLETGDVTTINLTRIQGGVQTNVLPKMLELIFDVRIAVDVDMQKFYTMVEGWCKEAGEDVEMVFEERNYFVEPTKLDENNLYWTAFKKAADDLKIVVKPRIFPGGTDSQYIREVGIPAFGFSPMINTPVLLHDHNEYLHAEVFLKGIEIYEKIIPAIANV